MFGYLTIYKDALSEDEKAEYQAYYCGLCRTLKKKFGLLSEIILAYDLVFLALLSNGLYEEPETERDTLCLMKMKKIGIVAADALDYAADMNLLLSYHNYIDQAHDSASKKAVKAVKRLKKVYRETAERYPRQKAAVEDYMRALSAYEKAPDDNPDTAANLTGRMLAEVFLEREDAWAATLRPMFFYLGKYIYLCDAYADVSCDLQSGDYNPYKALSERADFTDIARAHLESVMGECTRYFEMLPIFRHRSVLRNILYSGVWVGFVGGTAGREEKKNET